MNDNKHFAENVRLSDDGSAVIIIDQTRLPGETVYLELREPGQLHDAICDMRVRGAPAIGIFAAYAIYVLAKALKFQDFDEFYKKFVQYRKCLNSARPTAVNLSKMLRRMDNVVQENRERPIGEIVSELKIEAEKIQREDIEMCRAISEYGLELVEDGFGILTHCNAGPLATSVYGTGLGPLFLGHERGMKFSVYCDETRPLLQGARLTAYELGRAGIDCTLICDNMASIVMREGKINACFVGCDRVAANGDTANKIGTSGIAILAKHYNIPFYVFCPSSTIDFNRASGDEIKIEVRDPSEITKMFFDSMVAPEEVKCYNPAFDITDHSLITAIITEKGICREPYTESLKAFFGQAD